MIRSQAMMGGAFHAAGAPPGPPGPAAPAAAAPQAPRPAPVPVPPPVVFGAPGGPLRPPAPAPAPAPPQGQPLFNFNSNAAPFVPNNPWPNPPPPAGEFDDMPPLEGAFVPLEPCRINPLTVVSFSRRFRQRNYDSCACTGPCACAYRGPTWGVRRYAPARGFVFPLDLIFEECGPDPAIHIS